MNEGHNVGDDGVDQRNDLVFRAPLPHPWAAAINNHTSNTPRGSTDNHENNHSSSAGRLLSDAAISAALVACHVLRLSDETTFAAICLFHRFHIARHGQGTNNVDLNTKLTIHSNKKEFLPSPALILVSCILLATKSQEEPRRLRDFINLSHMLSWDDDEPECGGRKKNETNHHSQNIAAGHSVFWKANPPPLDEAYWETKERVVATEQHVLRWLGFDIHVSNAHRAVVALIQQQKSDSRSDQLFILTKDANAILNQVAVYSTQALMIPVVPLAVAAIRVAEMQQSRSSSTPEQTLVFQLGNNQLILAKKAEKEIQETLRRLQGSTPMEK